MIASISWRLLQELWRNGKPKGRSELPHFFIPPSSKELTVSPLPLPGNSSMGTR